MAPVISTNELIKIMNLKEDYVLIDVREPEELVNGMIPTAKNIPLEDFELIFGESPAELQRKYGLKLEKTTKIIFYCRTGHRSGIAANFAEKKGYRAYNYAGSVLEWSRIDPKVKMY